MVADLLSYPHSILNPAMKVLSVVLFATGAYVFYLCRCRYGGKLKVIAALLLIGGIAGLLASLFRFEGDYFTGWKWLESTFFLALAIISLVIAFMIRRKLKNAIRLFGFEEGSDQK